MIINIPNKDSFNNIDIVGVAICKVGPTQQHIGILFKNEASEPSQLLHLAWHYRLQCNPPNIKYVWLDCGLDPYNKAALAAYCQLIFHVNGPDRIPYGIDVSCKCFDPMTGAWIATNKNDGLTCSTFVMEVFAAQGHNLLDVSTWQHRASDEDWQLYIIDKLMENGADDKHIAYQLESIGAFRFRPEEVAGAVPQDTYPISFPDAVKYAHSLLERLNEYSASLP